MVNTTSDEEIENKIGLENEEEMMKRLGGIDIKNTIDNEYENPSLEDFTTIQFLFYVNERVKALYEEKKGKEAFELSQEMQKVLQPDFNERENKRKYKENTEKFIDAIESLDLATKVFFEYMVNKKKDDNEIIQNIDKQKKEIIDTIQGIKDLKEKLLDSRYQNVDFTNNYSNWYKIQKDIKTLENLITKNNYIQYDRENDQEKEILSKNIIENINSNFSDLPRKNILSKMSADIKDEKDPNNHTIASVEDNFINNNKDKDKNDMGFLLATFFDKKNTSALQKIKSHESGNYEENDLYNFFSKEAKAKNKKISDEVLNLVISNIITSTGNLKNKSNEEKSIISLEESQMLLLKEKLKKEEGMKNTNYDNTKEEKYMSDYRLKNAVLPKIINDIEKKEKEKKGYEDEIKEYTESINSLEKEENDKDKQELFIQELTSLLSLSKKIQSDDFKKTIYISNIDVAEEFTLDKAKEIAEKTEIDFTIERTLTRLQKVWNKTGIKTTETTKKPENHKEVALRKEKNKDIITEKIKQAKIEKNNMISLLKKTVGENTYDEKLASQYDNILGNFGEDFVIKHVIDSIINSSDSLDAKMKKSLISDMSLKNSLFNIIRPTLLSLEINGEGKKLETEFGNIYKRISTDIKNQMKHKKEILDQTVSKRTEKELHIIELLKEKFGMTKND